MTEILSGRLLQAGDEVWYDSKQDLRGRVTRKTDRRIQISWVGGNSVWYQFHQMWTKIERDDHG